MITVFPLSLTLLFYTALFVWNVLNV